MTSILIVDDVEMNVILLEAMVADIADATSVPFTSAKAALAWCEQHTPDLVLVDYVMPEMNGSEFTTRLRLIPACNAVPVVVISAQEDKSSLVRALEAGANDFLRKPVEAIELRARCRSMLKLGGAMQDLYRLATTDELTGLLNRRRFLVDLADEVARVARYGNDFSVAMFDIDHFKQVNDRHGHAAGDAVLRMIGHIARTTMRGVDIIGRLGGEEFAVAMPSTGRINAERAAERLRAAVEQARITTGSGELGVTVSIGLAAYAGDMSAEALLARADAALYAAKASGRNRLNLAA